MKQVKALFLLSWEANYTQVFHKASIIEDMCWQKSWLIQFSDSCLEGLAGFIQEPLINSLVKIAQWKGVDNDLEPFYN